MYRLFRRFLDVSEVQRRRRRAQIDASPRSTVELCRLLQRRGRVKAACEAAREGLTRFPRSALLRDILGSTWRRSSGRKVAELEAKIARDPSVENHLALSEYLTRFGEHQAAADACRRMVDCHPGDSRAAFVLGRILLTRFHRDHVARDGAQGLQCLQRASELDPLNFEAHLELAETYYYIGAVGKALGWVYKALEVQPDNAEANRLHRVLARLPLEERPEGDLLLEVEENDEVHFTYGRDADADLGSLRRRLEQLSMLAGVRRVLLSNRGADMVIEGGRKLDQNDESLGCLIELAKGFRRTASLSAKRMGIGTFEEAKMFWNEGVLLALGLGSSILLLEIDGGDQRLATIAAEAHNFLAGVAPVGSTGKETLHA